MTLLQTQTMYPVGTLVENNDLVYVVRCCKQVSTQTPHIEAMRVARLQRNETIPPNGHGYNIPDTIDVYVEHALRGQAVPTKLEIRDTYRLKLDSTMRLQYIADLVCDPATVRVRIHTALVAVQINAIAKDMADLAERTYWQDQNINVRQLKQNLMQYRSAGYFSQAHRS